jgi:uncharacterized membrane protein YdjX (TVP38/TMEM64 family)
VSDGALAADAPRPSRAFRGLLGLLLAGALGAAALYGRDVDPVTVLAVLERLRGWGPVAFVALYALLSLLLVPTLPLNLGAGILWGPIRGGLYSAAGATLGGAGAFLLARYLLGATAAHGWTGGRWRSLQEELERSDWRVVAFTRLSPVFPTGVLNYCYGLTRIPFATFGWSTFLFLLPGSVLFAGLGRLAGQVLLEGEYRHLAHVILLVSAAATGLVLLRWVLRRGGGDLVEACATSGGKVAPRKTLEAVAEDAREGAQPSGAVARSAVVKPLS